ncbi:unnamed protein product [Arabidopsis lyrata]|nr:unnamed protein product [Arabidopsis lyrata]
MSSPLTSPATTNGEEPLYKKQKKNPSQIPSLPDELLVSCLARVSRLHYATLSLVSKSFRSLIASPELYKTRVSILDCQTHTWHEAPSMQVKQYYPHANVVDGKIYVAGSCVKPKSSNWMEVFDPKTQTWELVLATLGKRFTHCINKSAVIEGAIYMFVDDIGVVYKPREGKWAEIRSLEDLQYLGFCYCVIGNVLYCYYWRNGIIWYDFKIRKWMNMKGLEGLPQFPNYGCVVRLVEYGGKMVILWNKYGSGCNNNKMIWCAVISLERRNSKEIWGKVEWVDAVLTVPVSCETVCALSATV